HYVLVEGPIRGTVERDVVVVVNPAEVRKLQMAGKRSGFAGDAFHEVAITANGVYVEVKDLEAGLVEIYSEPFAGDSHSDAIARALSERAGCGFDTGGDVGLRMPGSLTSDLPEALDFVHGDGERIQDFADSGGFFHACEMQS